MSCPSFMCVGPPAEQKSGTRLAPLIAGVGEYRVFEWALPFVHRALRRD
jgi:hypothetical protein